MESEAGYAHALGTGKDGTSSSLTAIARTANEIHTEDGESGAYHIWRSSQREQTESLFNPRLTRSLEEMNIFLAINRETDENRQNVKRVLELHLPALLYRQNVENRLLGSHKTFLLRGHNLRQQ